MEEEAFGTAFRKHSGQKARVYHLQDRSTVVLQSGVDFLAVLAHSLADVQCSKSSGDSEEQVIIRKQTS
jgi:hypothetical protein